MQNQTCKAVTRYPTEQYPHNYSSFTQFLLLRFSEDRELQVLFFILFLVYYLVTVGANLLITSAVATDHHLHNSMYFFLMNLAIQDIGQVTVIFPKAMANSLLDTRHISYSGCIAQVLFYVFFAASDISLLTVMAYDRYVAICNPLRYEILINKQACLQMIAIVWIISFLYGILHTGGTFAAPFCSNTVHQFFCEIPQLIKLACSDMYLIEVGFLLLSAVAGAGCFIFIIVTYMLIITAVLKIPSLQGSQKAFSTCLPHVIVVSVFILTAVSVYLKPFSDSPFDLGMAFTLLYSMVPPLINPIIYSLTKKEIKMALSKVIGLRYFSADSL